jgi:4-diphosphocytidyl-2-C-methyl-D-erythritol kinase
VRTEGGEDGASLARAHAKLNVGLRVLGRRSDGFHEIDSVMASIDLHDDVAVRAEGAADVLVRLPAGDDRLDRAPLPLDGGNLVLRALERYRLAAAAAGDAPPPPLRIALRKRVPIAAGLGGGSSDAAAVLRLLAASWPAAIDLLQLGAELGSDVPFFLSGHAWARSRGRGERLEAVAAPALRVVLVNPGVGVSAADAYRWRAEEAGLGDRRAPWRGFDLANDLEPGVAARVPEVAEVLAWLRAQAPHHPVAMSGSGATCFAVVEDERAAEELAARARRAAAWWVRVARALPSGG